MSVNSLGVGNTAFTQIFQEGMSAVMKSFSGINPSDASGVTSASNESGNPSIAEPDSDTTLSGIATMFIVLGKIKEIKDSTIAANKAELERVQAEQEDLMNEQIDKLNEQEDNRLDQIEKAEKARKKAKEAGIFGKAFGFLTAVATMVGGAASLVAGVVASQPNLIAAGVALTAAGMCEVAAQVCIMFGEHEAAEILSYTAIALTVIGVGLLTYGAASGAAAGAAAGKEVAKEATEVAVKEGVKAAAKEAASEAAEEVVEQAAKAVVKEISKNVSEEIAENAIERAAKNLCETMIRKQSDDMIKTAMGRTTWASSAASMGAQTGSGIISAEQADIQEALNKVNLQVQLLESELVENEALVSKLESILQCFIAFIQSQSGTVVDIASILSDAAKNEMQASLTVLNNARAPI